ncbi:hypothetical protein ANTQUA_LOCUS1728 [Anthophora quadrimaculata]
MSSWPPQLSRTKRTAPLHEPNEDLWLGRIKRRRISRRAEDGRTRADEGVIFIVIIESRAIGVTLRRNTVRDRFREARTCLEGNVQRHEHRRRRAGAAVGKLVADRHPVQPESSRVSPWGERATTDTRGQGLRLASATTSLDRSRSSRRRRFAVAADGMRAWDRRNDRRSSKG